MGNAKRDDNYVPTLIAVSNADGSTPVTLYADPTTHRLLVSATNGSLNDLSDVTITSAAQGDILYHNGTSWVNLAAGTSGKFLKTQGAGANPIWDTPTSGAAGSDTQVQFNDGGSILGGDAGMTYNKTTDTLTLAGNLQAEDILIEDSDASHYLTITTTSNLTAARTLTIVPGDASRTLTISGDATISQDYSTSGNPQFATVELGHTSDTTLSRSAAGVLAVEGIDVVLGTVGATDNALIRANGTGTHTIQGTSATATLSDNNDLTLYDATNDGNPIFAFGASATERLTIIPTYDAGAQTLDFVEFATSAASATADKGKYIFDVDGTDILTINDSGITVGTTLAVTTGSIELGHATDTTIARVSAGVISVEGVTIPTISSTNTLTNKRITSRVQSVSDSATITPDADANDCVDITAIAQAFTIANPSGTPTNFQKLIIRIKDNATARAITWGNGYVAGGVALPSTTVLSKILTLGFIYNTANSLNKWQLVASAQEA